jgi:hypothetical protein
MTSKSPVYLIICLCALLLHGSFSHAQSATTEETWHLGLSAGTGTMNDVHGELGFSSQTGWIYEFHFLRLSGRSQNTPPDYSGGIEIFGQGANPRVIMTSGGMTIGKYFVLSPSARAALQGGLLAGGFKEPYNFTPVDNGGWFNLGPNYDFDFREGGWVGLYLHPEIFIVGRKVGMKLGSNLVINAYRTSFTLDAGLLLGNLRGSVNSQ